MRDLPLGSSILDYVLEAPGINEKDAIRQLASAGFPFAKIDEPIGVLSHGERARLVFLKMKLLRPNMYLLDEPTNHLDIEGQEDLEEQLEQSDVSCLFVSHDRYFTRTVANRFLEIRKGRLVEIDDAESFFDRREVS
jgi:ATPase subunit of ABC transporter with duplicated ATPase domains